MKAFLKKEIFAQNDVLRHHSFGIESQFIEQEKIIAQLNEIFPFLYVKIKEKILLEDIQEIHFFSQQKKEKLSPIVIAFQSIGRESQNALLKLIEEPKGNSVYFLIYTNKKELLDTILSRIYRIKFPREIIQNTLDEKKGSLKKLHLEEFIYSSRSERLKLLSPFYKKTKGNDASFTKEDLIFFLNDLELFFYQKRTNKEVFELYRKLHGLKKLIIKSGVHLSLKFILEYLALSIPVLEKEK